MRILTIFTQKDGFQRVKINSRTQCYHRVIALQFVPNPDPKQYTEVNHKNHIRNDNRPENLEWVIPSANRKDRLPFTQSKKRFTKELPEGSIPIVQYKGFTFIDCYFNPTTEEILKKVKDRFQFISQRDGYKQFSLIDTNKVQHHFGLKTFVKNLQA